MKKLLFIAILCLIITSIQAQDKWLFNTGIGLPKLAYAGMGRKIGFNNQLKLSLGIAGSVAQGSIIGVTLEHNFLLKESNKFEGLHTWYFGQQIPYQHVRESDISLPEIEVTDLIGLSLVLGRQINFNAKNGVNLELGPLYYFYASNSLSEFEQNDLTIAGSIGYFLRF